jgi:general secretion pathway protein D
MPSRSPAAAKLCAAAMMLATFPCALMAQTAGQVAPASQNTQADQAPPAAAEIPSPAKDKRLPRGSDKRRAADLYLASSKLFLNRQFEQAMQGFDRAAHLDPTNPNYPLASNVARGHAVTALIQAAAKDRLLGNEADARASLTHALALDPRNIEASQHLDELGDEVARTQPKSLYSKSAGTLGDAEPLLAAPGVRSFHLHNDQRQVIVQVFKAYGLTAMIDDSVRPIMARLDIDDATYEEAARVLGMLTNTFYVPLDAHHVVVANNARDIRERLIPQKMETVYLGGLTDDELNQVQILAKDVFGAQQVQASLAERTISLRAPGSTLEAFNSTMRNLLEGRSEVLLDVRMIQVAHTSNRNTGAQLPQTFSAFNVFAEEQSILNANQSLVQQIISSGLASPNDPLAILGILIASGQVSSSLLSGGFALFGGGLTQSALAPGTTTFNLNLNTSDSRELDQIQLRLEDGEQGTLKEGERYPIQTSSYSSLSPNLPNIPGLTGAGASGSLSSLLSSLTSSVPNVPMVQYQDLGLTLNATPKVLRDNDVALSIDMKLDALSGTEIDGNPVLNNRAYSGVVTLREGEAAVVATEVDKSQSLAISGTPGLSEIPGMNDITGKDSQQDYATIVIVMTPHVVRGPQATGRTAMMRVENVQPAR